jgi:hypothetical protein
MEGTGRAAAERRSALANAAARSNRDGISIAENRKSLKRHSQSLSAKDVQKVRVRRK